MIVCTVRHSLETQSIVKEVVLGGSLMQVQNSRVSSANDAVPQDHLVTTLWGGRPGHANWCGWT